MLVPIIKIGNSQGVRIPKPLLQQVGIIEAVALRVEGDSIVLRPVARQPREGWAAMFRDMAARGDDVLLDVT